MTICASRSVKKISPLSLHAARCRVDRTPIKGGRIASVPRPDDMTIFSSMLRAFASDRLRIVSCSVARRCNESWACWSHRARCKRASACPLNFGGGPEAPRVSSDHQRCASTTRSVLAGHLRRGGNLRRDNIRAGTRRQSNRRVPPGRRVWSSGTCWRSSGSGPADRWCR